MELGLAGKSVLITGGSRGIGFAAARAFAAEGCRLHLAARSQDTLTAAGERITSEFGVPISLHALDMRRSEEVAALAEACGDVDALINNAGATPTGPIETTTEADFREGFELKLIATASLTRAIYLAMKKRQRGVIINVIGNCGERPDPEIIVATITNTGLMGFTRALGAVSPAHGIRVLGVNPGPTATERLVGLMQRKSADRTGDADRWEELVKPLPFGRAADPRETADMIVFAASERCSYVSGTILTVDGGVAWRGHLF
jgi:NAD(P)-dependent dehydrogenase (short-subunit alcohol dehydrogenase family)